MLVIMAGHKKKRITATVLNNKLLLNTMQTIHVYNSNSPSKDNSSVIRTFRNCYFLLMLLYIVQTTICCYTVKDNCFFIFVTLVLSVFCSSLKRVSLLFHCLFIMTGQTEGVEGNG